MNTTTKIYKISQGFREDIIVICPICKNIEWMSYTKHPHRIFNNYHYECNNCGYTVVSTKEWNDV